MVLKQWGMANARDAIHGATFDRAETTFPTVVYARYTRNWGKPVAARVPGPLVKARVGDKLRIHFKNMDTLTSAPHSMHFHGVAYKPSSDGVWLPLHSGKGGNVNAAKLVGTRVAEKAKAAGVETVAFDRAGYRFHGRVKALAEAAREAGLKF